MPRRGRSKSKTGIYHVMARGINRDKIFHSERDYEKYFEILKNVKEISKFNMFAYCLMSNHVHLLIKEGEEPISQIMKRVNSRYAQWYNYKYERIGHVFQDRFKSECVDNDSYLLTVIRYIHQNPVKAKIIEKPEYYKWSSCSIYYQNCGEKFIESSVILSFFNEDENIARTQFRKFIEEPNKDQCLDDEEFIKISDEQLRLAIEEILDGNSISTLKNMNKIERSALLKKIKKIKGATIRQISRVTGLGYNIIFRA